MSIFARLFPRARHGNPLTSQIAAEGNRDSQLMAILDRLMSCGQHGATAEELDLFARWPAATAGRRVADLVKAGYLWRTDRTRLTTRQRPASVHVITEFGRAAWRAQSSITL